MQFRNSVLAAAALSLLPPLAATPSLAAPFIKIKFREVKVRTVGRDVPRIVVSFADGRWRATSDVVHFRLSIFARVNLGSNITRIVVGVPDLRGRTWKAYDSVVGGGLLTNKVFVRSTHRQFFSHSLGYYSNFAANLCAAMGRNRPGSFDVSRTIPIQLHVHAVRGAWKKLKARKTYNKTVPVTISCRRTSGRAGEAARPFRIKGAGVRLVKVGRHCPVKVFASVRVYANKPGTVRYVLRSSLGRRWVRTLQIRAKNNRGLHEGRFDHVFHARKSVRQERFWVEIKGRRIGRSSRLTVTCLRPAGGLSVGN
jgi:hypothetical protein